MCCFGKASGGSESSGRSVWKIADGGGDGAPSLSRLHANLAGNVNNGHYVPHLAGKEDRGHDAFHAIDMQSVDAGLTVHKVVFLEPTCPSMYLQNLFIVCA